MNKIEFRGELISLNKLAMLFGLNPSTVYSRYERGYRGEDLVKNTSNESHRFGKKKAKQTLDNDSVKEIRDKLSCPRKGVTQYTLAREYNVTQSEISRVNTRQRWSDVV